MSFLLLSLDGKTTTRTEGGPGDELAPWGLTHDGEVVFAPRAPPPPKVGSRFSQYDRNHNVRRRVRFESYLAALVLLDPGPVMPAIRRLNAGIDRYLEERRRAAQSDPALGKVWENLGDDVRTWLYNDDLGRLGRLGDAPAGASDVMARALEAIDRGSLQQILNVHATVIGMIVAKLGYTNDGDRDRDLGNKARLKPGALFDEDKRGRRRREVPDQTGVTSVGFQHPKDLAKATARRDPELATLLEVHPRAVGAFERAASSERLAALSSSGSEPPFVASYSGSTTELLRLALLLGNFDEEGMRQYALAVAAFLIGGGHHSFHEVMSIANLAGLAYRPGQYDAMLPASFKRTAWYDQMIDGFADVLFSEYWPEVSLNFAVR